MRSKLKDILSHSYPVPGYLLFLLIIALVVTFIVAVQLWDDRESNYVPQYRYDQAVEARQAAIERARNMKYRKLLDDARNKNRERFDTTYIDRSTDDSTKAVRQLENLRFIRRLGLDKGLPK